jgi:hypothetical protein
VTDFREAVMGAVAQLVIIAIMMMLFGLESQ